MKDMIERWVRLSLVAPLLWSCGSQGGDVGSEAVLPDLQPLLPAYVSVARPGDAEILAFAIALANDGDGDLHLDTDLSHSLEGVQRIHSAQGETVLENAITLGLLDFRLHRAADEGGGGLWEGVVIDDRGEVQSDRLNRWAEYHNPRTGEDVPLALLDRSNDSINLAAGWIGYPRHAGQPYFDVSAVDAGVYYLVAAANGDGTIIESNYDNNVAWLSFELRRSGDQVSIAVLNRSICHSPTMCRAFRPE